MECSQNTTVIPDNSPLDCDGIITSTTCIAHPTAISFLNLPAESTQAQINSALTTALVAAYSRILALENRVTTLENV